MANHGDRFRRRALSRGYKVDEVDAFLDRVEATLAGEPMGSPVPSQEVDDVVFRVRFGGYDEWQVDVYLDRVARQLSELEERGVLGRAPSPEFVNGPQRHDDMPGRGDDMRDMPPRDRDMPPPREHGPRDMPPRDMPPRDMPPPREHGPRDMPPRDMPPRDMPPPREHGPRDMRDAPMGAREMSPPGREPGRDRHAMHAEPSTPPPTSRRPEPPRGRPERGAPPVVEDDGESFAHLRADDGEGFGHLAPRIDDDDPFGGRPTRRHHTPPAGFDRRGEERPPPGADRFDGPPADRFDGPPPGADRFDAPPPDRFEPPTERFEAPPPERFEPGPDRPAGGPPHERFAPPQERRFPPEPEPFGARDGGRPPAAAPPPPAWGAEPGPGFERPTPPRGFDDDMTRPIRRPVEEPEVDSQLTQRLRRGTDDRFAPPAQRGEPVGPPPGVDPTPPRGVDPGATMPHPVVPQPSRPASPYGDQPPYGEQPGYGEPRTVPPVSGPPGEPAGAKVDYGRRNPYEGRGVFDGPGRHGREEMTTELRTSDSPFTPQDLQRLEQLRGAFQPRRFGSGYDPAQVDRIFDAMSANMTGRSPVPVSDKELDTSQFSLVQRGYFEAEVDAALREVRDIFAKRGMVR
ncbi:DivIVA domain-containing protein [Stackebrandtia albiflava]|uniref:DivIVA domain-containing protein n=1 Tax=Stackebrandtia albiflava TaxID=406432 RepID=A0A562VAH7_9ACTN|nr:DivIVA domain-containing protein [Stackebrandtia albiflava]